MAFHTRLMMIENTLKNWRNSIWLMIKNRLFHKKIYIYVLVIMTIALFFLGLIWGSVKIPIKDVLVVLSGQDKSSRTAFILLTVRLPRVCAAFLAGAGLGTAGVILQAVMNNSLASPNTIGVNSGAGFFAMLSMILFPQNLLSKSIMAFGGALLTSLLIVALAYIADKSRITIVLAGITVSSFLSAGMNMMKILDTDITINAMQFVIGSLSGVTMKSIKYPSVGIGIALAFAVIMGKALNILALGDGVASSLGLRVHLTRIVFVVLSSIMSGLVVSFAGLIGFVGLIVPHICRYFLGNDARILIPACSVLGGSFVIFCDLLGRAIFTPYELPAGIILSLAGAPFFLYLLMRKGGRRLNA